MALNVKPRIQKATLEHVRILTFDIERLPGRAKVHHRGLTVEGSFWDLGSWKHTINRRIHPDDVLEWPSTICAAGRFYGEKEVRFTSTWDDGETGFLQTMWDWFDECDILIGHNANSFDVKKVRSDFINAGFPPPSPFKVVDTLRVARSELGHESNTLDSLCQRLGVKAKTDKYNPDVAQAAVSGDTKAQRRIRNYNCGDVVATEQLFDRLRPYIKSGPHLSMWTGNAYGCPNCGADVSRNPTGEAYANVTRYKAFQCEKCGTHIRGNKKLQDPTATRIYR